MFVGEFQYACLMHTFIFYLLRQNGAQLKKFTSWCGPAKLKDNKKLKLDK